MTNLECALRYREQLEWSVFPVKPNKRPQLETWEEYQRRLPTIEEINGWWKKWPEAGIAVVTGKISNLCVIDVDKPDLEITKTNTLTSQTGRGGMHYFFRPNGVNYGCRVGVVDGVDVRGEGGYVVVPPSVHSTGTRYKWRKLAEPTEIPLDVKAILDGKRKPRTVIPEGKRNNEVTSMVGRLVRSGISSSDVLDLAHSWNLKHCSPPLSRYEIEIIVGSIAKTHVKNHPASKEFDVVSFSEVINRYANFEVDWAVDNWLPTSTVGLVVAPPGSYKTWMLLDLALSISTGRPFLGKHEVLQQGPVLIIQQEDPFPLLLSRMANIMGLGDQSEDADQFEISLPFQTPNIHWHTNRALNFNNENAVAGFMEAIEKHRPVLTVIDPLYSMVDADDYMAEGAQDMLLLKRLRDQFGCSFIVAHHTTKHPTKGDRVRDDVWGSQFLNAWLETGWQIRTGPNPEHTIIHRHFKMSERQPPLTLKFQITNNSYSVEEEDYVEDSVHPEAVEDEKTSTVDKADLDVKVTAEVLKGRVTGAYDLSQTLNVGISTLNASLRRIGAVKKTNGVYEIPV